MSIFILNNSFIVAEAGIIDTLVDGLYLNLENTINIKKKGKLSIPIGRICSPLLYPTHTQNQLTLEDLIKRIQNNLGIKYLSYVGDLAIEIRKICIFGGELDDIHLIDKAIKHGCNCLISGKISYNNFPVICFPVVP